MPVYRPNGRRNPRPSVCSVKISDTEARSEAIT